ncbi:uncharacterized protein LOC141489130 [Macrotis lagotis]|uniref:uncharacterized protein LOC141489130 n=1 Tax=Macrotis lagotis TaxID=92651 RepID=UPI003D69D8AF
MRKEGEKKKGGTRSGGPDGEEETQQPLPGKANKRGDGRRRRASRGNHARPSLGFPRPPQAQLPARPGPRARAPRPPGQRAPPERLRERPTTGGRRGQRGPTIRFPLPAARRSPRVPAARAGPPRECREPERAARPDPAQPRCAPYLLVTRERRRGRPDVSNRGMEEERRKEESSEGSTEMQNSSESITLRSLYLLHKIIICHNFLKKQVI